jgi:hypothetical protein
LFSGVPYNLKGKEKQDVNKSIITFDKCYTSVNIPNITHITPAKGNKIRSPSITTICYTNLHLTEEKHPIDRFITDYFKILFSFLVTYLARKTENK